MIEEKLSKTEILKMIEEKKITAKEGLVLLDEHRAYKKVESKYSSSITKTYHPQWEERDLIAEPGNRLSDTIILFDYNSEIRDSLKADTVFEASPIILVTPGRKFRKNADYTYEINPLDKTDYNQLFENLQKENLLPDKIIHLWAKEQFGIVVANVKKQVEVSFYTLLYISQAVLQIKMKKKSKVIFIYPTHQKVEPLYGAVSGFAKTIQLENPNFVMKAVAVEQEDTNKSSSRLKIITGELLNKKSETEIKYRGGRRFIKKFYETQLPSTQGEPVQIKKKGAYIITGGTGGIGRIIARYLAGNFHCNLILTGRSLLNESKKQVIDELNTLGGNAIYISSDLSKTADVEYMLEECQVRFGKINGIFHCAGVIYDALALNKEKETIEEVFAPKIYGSISICEKLITYPVDFLVFFSGLAGVVGNVGQIDYAYANAFEDNYALYLTEELPNTRILSINWPLWENGGMQIEPEQKEWLSKTYGLLPMGNEKGMEVLVKTLDSSYEQVIVALTKADKQDMISEMLNEENKETEAPKPVFVTVSKEIGKGVEDYLKKVISTELKLAKGSIIPTEPWEKYGIDSMSIVKMTNEIEKVFGAISKTLFFEYKNLHELTQYFVENHKEIIAGKLIKNNQSADISKTTIPPVQKTPAYEEKIPKNNRFFTVPANNKTCNAQDENDIAIIGISGKYPMADNLEEYWNNLVNGVDCITEIPAARWDYQKYYTKEKGIKDKAYSKWGGFLSNHDMFDPLFFGITPRDAEMMDPQERLFLEVTWQAIEDAGYNLDKLKKFEVGVYVGVMYGHYQIFGAEETLQGNTMALSSSYASIANRISYMLDLTGPSIAIDTMCSSSLTTIHLACESIHRGECQMAVAGGVNLTIHPTKHQYLCANNFASTDGRCRSFGEGGDGYVPGEGVGALVIKTLHQAKLDGDHIYAVIKASSINHGGRSNGYTVPNPNSQSDLITKTLEKAHMNPRSISYIEAHGTGTSLGDPIEITGLTKSFNQYTQDKQYCAIGSVKSNIGHAEAAAGIAGITKIVLQMQHKQLVPSLHSKTANPNINFEDTPFYVQRECTKWKPPSLHIDGKTKECPRIAGISAFGAGGSNAHIILEEYTEEELPIYAVMVKPQIIILSARNQNTLKQYAHKLMVHMEKLGSQAEENEGSLPQVQQIICRLIGELIQVEAFEVEKEDTILELNLDMVKLNLLVERINSKFEVDLTIQEVLENPTVGSITAFLSRKYKTQLKKYCLVDEKQETNYEWTNQINIDDLAYTLQTGREEKDCRLAVIASNLKELHQKLRDFCKEKQENIDILTNTSVEKMEFPEEELIVPYIVEQIQNKNQIELAKLWVSGIKIDWNLLYGNKKPRVMPLPTYPFEKKHYWYNSFQKTQEDREKLLIKSSENIISNKPSGVVSNGAVSNGFESELDFQYAVENYTGTEVSLQIIDESIALITMHDEKNRNMFAKNLVLGLMARFAQVQNDSRIKSIIVTGYGNIFSMGGTQEQLLSIADQKNSFTDVPFLYRGLLESPIPVITAIQGHATGGGLLFGLFGDIVIMAKEGIYCAVFAKYGFTPGMGATYILKEKFGHNLSSEMMYTAKSYSGEELYQKGANVTFKKSKDVLKEALSIARSLSEKPLITLRTLKSELASKILMELPEYIKSENLMHQKTFGKPEVKERIRHFYLEDKDFNVDKNSNVGKKVSEDNKVKTAELVKLSKPEIKDMSTSTMDLESILKALEAGEVTPDEAILLRQKNNRSKGGLNV